MDSVSLLSSSSDEDDNGAVIAAVLSLKDDHQRAIQAVSIVLEDLVDEDSNYEGDYSVNSALPKISRLFNLISGHASTFRMTTGFTLSEWERFCQKCCPLVIAMARHSGELKVKQGRPTKLSPQERVLSFVLYVKHNTQARLEAVNWNYSRTSLNGDGAFIASVINVALADEIQWPDQNRRRLLGRVLPGFEGCIGHIDGTLCRIRRPCIPEHKKYYNNRKAMYCLNSVVVVDHDGLFIYVEAGYAGSYHDVRCLRLSDLYRNWRQYFKNDDRDRVEEYLLGDPGYMGADMFIFRRIDNREADDANPVVRAFNKRHAAKRIQVEWGIGGMKTRFRRFLGTCPTYRDLFAPVFEACCRMTNFIHRSRLDFSIVEVGEIAMDNINEFFNDWAA
jgi:hypothetical protein